jgi:dihydrofolate synthase/folylpolyglutamate synthase
MRMDYDEAMAFINESHKYGSKLGLDRIRTLMEYMGNPEKKLKFVHVGGTNGKGSTASFISNILIEAGYKVGVYTSPYIHRFSERIRINNLEIPEEDIARITDSIEPKIMKMLENGSDPVTEFEIVTAMAFQYFCEKGCDIVVLEVGLGGRMDSTNIIDKTEVSVITTIDFDHMDMLGETLPQIAYEKAGIIKKNGTVVLYPQEYLIEKLFDVVCEERRAELHKVDFSNLLSHSYGLAAQEFDFESYKSLKISLLGDHQIKNAAVAIKAVGALIDKGYKINESDIREGLQNTRWAGRLEILNEKPLFLVDGAHNIEGAENLSRNLKRLFPGKKITFIAGVLADKDYKSMLKQVIPIAEKFITVTPGNPRALNAQDLAACIESSNVKVSSSVEIEEAVHAAIGSASAGDVICAFGSLYYIGQVRECFGLLESKGAIQHG